MLKLKILAILCSLFFAINLIADDDEHKKYKDYKEKYYKSSKSHFYRNLDYLKLSDEQSEKLKEILINYKIDYKKFYKFKKTKEYELSKLFEKNSFSNDEYKKIYNEIKEKSLNLEILIFSEIHAILNEEQREKFSYFLEEWKVE